MKKKKRKKTMKKRESKANPKSNTCLEWWELADEEKAKVPMHFKALRMVLTPHGS